MPDFITTYTGSNIYPLSPSIWDIEIIDIAHALSNICRFQGHCKEFYSVAQHSVIVSNLVRPEIALRALLHDASEAYICDLSRPLKGTKLFKNYHRVEQKLMRAICDRFNILFVDDTEIKAADTYLLATEARQFGLMNNAWGIKDIPSLPIIIDPLPPKEAEALFLERYRELMVK